MQSMYVIVQKKSDDVILFRIPHDKFAQLIFILRFDRCQQMKLSTVVFFLFDLQIDEGEFFRRILSDALSSSYPISRWRYSFFFVHSDLRLLTFVFSFVY